MKISRKDWQKYITLLRKVSDTAADKVAKYMDTIDINSEEGMRALLDYSYAVATKYGEGATALACQMYDEIASLSGASVPIAEPAATATYGEVAMSVRGKMMDTLNPDAIGAKVGLLVRRAGMDTTLHNAIRDVAEWAWIPSGDTCPFCLVLASNGWQKASSKVLKGNHADHIHANCDCSFAIRFDGRMDVEGYDPEALYEQYAGAEGATSTEKINFLRRQRYSNNPEFYRARKRLNYMRKTGALYGAYNDKNDPYFEKREKIGSDIYTEIRNRKRTYEIKAVANNSGFRESEIDTVFEHIFEKKHLFEDGSVKRFDPDYYMAQSWLRLREGSNIQKHDIIMLHHELEEARIMSENLEIPYEKAHNEVVKKWDYKKALIEYLKTHDA